MSLSQDIARPLDLKPGELGLTADALFAGAGITEAERFKLLRAAFNLIFKNLQVKTRKVFSHNGKVIYSRLLPDNLIRSRTIDQVFSMLGLNKQESPTVTIQVTVNQPPWMITPDIPAPVRDITPPNHEASIACQSPP